MNFTPLKESLLIVVQEAVTKLPRIKLDLEQAFERKCARESMLACCGIRQ